MKTYFTLLLFSALLALASMNCSKKDESNKDSKDDYSKVAPVDTNGAII